MILTLIILRNNERWFVFFFFGLALIPYIFFIPGMLKQEKLRQDELKTMKSGAEPHESKPRVTAEASGQEDLRIPDETPLGMVS